jgi:spermidine synthase
MATAGAIIGTLAAGLLVWWLGSQSVQRLLMALSTVAGLVVLVPLVRVRWTMALAVVAACCAIWMVPPISPLAVAYGRHSMLYGGHAQIFYVGEGLQTAVAVSRTAEGGVNYHNAGKVQASSEPQDMRLQRMLGHLTTLVPDDPRSVLVIGFGAGVTAGAVSIDPRVHEETVVEIEPLVPQARCGRQGRPA